MRRVRVPVIETTFVCADEPVDAFIATPSAVTPAEADTGGEPGLNLSMDTDAEEYPHLSIRMEARWSYRVWVKKSEEKKTGDSACAKPPGRFYSRREQRPS